ncbi:MAG: hypothetical protein ABEI58_00965, partial [Candidatus Nanohaloarchaea archaeon]
VDTSYDGDTSPSMPSDDTILLQEDESYDFTFELDENSESTDITATCYDSNDDKIDSDTNDVSSDDTQFTCSVDGGDYADTEQDIYIEMCDEAGNCQQSDTKTYVFDGSKPSLVEVGTDVTTVNSDFPVDFSATDVSGIDKLEYFYDDSTVDEGDGTSVDVSEDDSQFTASVSSLDRGNHTIYVRVKDGAERWSDTSSFDFEYLPNADPEVSLSAPDGVNVAAGKSTSFEVTVENTGKLLVSGVEVSASAGSVFSENQSTGELMPGDTETLSYDVDTEPGDIGKYTAKVSSSNPEASSSFGFIVEANSTQEQNLKQKLSEWNQTLQELKENVTSLKNSGLSESRAQRLENNLSDFEKRIENAREAKSKGNYYRVASLLDDADVDYRTAKSSYTKVREEHQAAQKRRLIMIGGGILLLLLLGGVGFVMYSEDHELDFDVDSGSHMGFLVDIEAKFKSIFKDEDEAEEFEWDGFR